MSGLSVCVRTKSLVSPQQKKAKLTKEPKKEKAGDSGKGKGKLEHQAKKSGLCSISSREVTKVFEQIGRAHV